MMFMVFDSFWNTRGSSFFDFYRVALPTGTSGKIARARHRNRHGDRHLSGSPGRQNADRSRARGICGDGGAAYPRLDGRPDYQPVNLQYGSARSRRIPRR